MGWFLAKLILKAYNNIRMSYFASHVKQSFPLRTFISYSIVFFKKAMNIFQIQFGMTLELLDVGPINLLSEFQAFINLEFSSSVDLDCNLAFPFPLLLELLGSVPARRNSVVGSRIQLLLVEGLTKMSSSPNWGRRRLDCFLVNVK